MISFVIPAFNESDRIGPTLSLLESFLREEIGKPFEIIVIDDGSTDSTREVVLSSTTPSVRCLSLERNRGKGAAVREGVQNARGEIIFLVDADLPYDLSFIERALEQIESGKADAVVGGRDLPSSTLDPSYPQIRIFAGKAFSWLVNVLIPVSNPDTQCGFKAFRAEPIRKAVLYMQRTDYTFDIEVLLFLRIWGREIIREPVQLRQHHGSKIRLFSDSLKMLASILGIAADYWRKRYVSEMPTFVLERTPCPACGESANHTLTIIDDFVRFAQCRHCSTLYQNPRPASSEINSLYRSKYFSSSNVRSGYLNYQETKIQKEETARWLWDQIQDSGDQDRHDIRAVLDVGCGSCEFLLEGKKRGYEAHGVDYFRHENAASLCSFFQGDFLDAEYPSNYFDLIVMNDSFEHFTAPQPVLARCRQILAGGGGDLDQYTRS